MTTDVMSAEEAQRLKTDARLAREFADVKDREAAWIALELAEAQQERDALHAQLAQVTAERDALRTRAEIAETELAGAHKAGGVGRGWWTAQTWWRSRPTPGRSEATEVAALRSIVEGRTTPPSDEEIAAHEAVGRGWWLCVLRGHPDVTTTSVAREWAQHHRAHPEDGGRWWPLDAQKRPCAWPVVDR